MLVTAVETAERLEEWHSTESLAPRYESLIRLAEAIRSHRDQKDLFQFLANELRHVVPFDAMAQFDHAGNRVNWHFSEAYNSKTARVSDIPKEETLSRLGPDILHTPRDNFKDLHLCPFSPISEP